MQQQSILRVALIAVFFGITAYLGYATVLSYMRWQAAEDYRSAAYGENYSSPPTDIPRLLSDIEGKQRTLGGDELRLMYMEQLLDYAWYYPDESVDSLRTAMGIGQDVYRSADHSDTYLIYRLSFAYLIAGLPTKFIRWRAEAVTQAPDSRPFIRFLEVYAELMLDDLDGARAVIEDDLAVHGGMVGTRSLALAGYTAIDDLEAAAQFADVLVMDEASDYFFTRSYGRYLLRSGDTASALEYLLLVTSEETTDPDYALSLAVAFAGEIGIDDPRVDAQLDTVLTDPRADLSMVGAKALVACQLFNNTGDVQWFRYLEQLQASHANDFHVAMNLADAAIDYLHDIEDVSLVDAASTDSAVDIDNTSHPTVALPRLLQSYCEDALALAESVGALQVAHIAYARALLHVDSGDVSVGDREQSLRHLRIALGDTMEADAVITQRIPDYEVFIQDEDVIALRQAVPEFDAAVHRVIIDYLNRRRVLFADIITLPELTYED